MTDTEIIEFLDDYQNEIEHNEVWRIIEAALSYLTLEAFKDLLNFLQNTLNFNLNKYFATDACTKSMGIGEYLKDGKISWTYDRRTFLQDLVQIALKFKTQKHPIEIRSIAVTTVNTMLGAPNDYFWQHLYPEDFENELDLIDNNLLSAKVKNALNKLGYQKIQEAKSDTDIVSAFNNAYVSAVASQLDSEFYTDLKQCWVDAGFEVSDDFSISLPISKEEIIDKLFDISETLNNVLYFIDDFNYNIAELYALYKLMGAHFVYQEDYIDDYNTVGFDEYLFNDDFKMYLDDIMSDRGV